MSVRVIARIRPLLKSEIERDCIVRASGHDERRPTLVKIPNPKNESEEYSFQFNGVYGWQAGQQELFDGEVAPTIKHLFLGFDVTIFAYGVTGTGKTHTMRGGKSLVDRGMIPRMLSGIYRRARKMEKDSNGDTAVEVSMSYYEIYNDRVFDLLEPPEKRTATGLPLRESGGGKTVIVGLTERPCESLKEFEGLYDEGNGNRSTGATKLNAHSSRSHAILCVKVTVTTRDETRISTASAIDLAGSEDNRRTDNGKERMVESASINKSLFVLAQCVEAISKKQARIPYRESKMTRILSLGQNNGFTVMILNLAPVRSYHLDTLSSLNFANRTKKIEVKEIENEPMFKGPPRAVPAVTGPSIQRKPLRPLASMINVNVAASTAKPGDKPDKPVKSFSVYSDHSKPPSSSDQTKRSDIPKRSSPLKRESDSFGTISGRPLKAMRPGDSHPSQRPRQEIPNVNIEEVVEKKVNEMLAARDSRDKASNAQVQRKLELLEQRLEGKDDERAEGLTYMLMAKQHTASGQYLSALKMYRLALPYFPDNDKLVAKISSLEGKIKAQKEGSEAVSMPRTVHPVQISTLTTQTIPQAVPQPEKIQKVPQKAFRVEKDDDYNDQSSHQSDEGYSSDEGFRYKTTKSKKVPKRKEFAVLNTSSSTSTSTLTTVPSPRTIHLLQIINSRDVSQIKLLKGVGMKRAEAIVDSLCDMDELGNDGGQILSLGQLGKLRGVGVKIVENMRGGIMV